LKKENEQLIQEMLLKTEEELLAILGAKLLENSQRFNELDNEDFEKSGRRWWKFNKHEVHFRICNSPKLSEFRENEETGNTVLLVTGVADVISGYFTGIAPFSVSCLAIRKGLKHICK